MPIPERYAQEVSDIVRIWQPEGYFKAQTKIWEAECQARHELFGEPTQDQLVRIQAALSLSPVEIAELTNAKGHETNKLLRKVQEKLPSKDGNFIHLGNTSSDVLDTSLALQIQASLDITKKDFEKLAANLAELALEHRHTQQIGRSHGIHAVPQVFGRQVLGWYSDVKTGISLFDQARAAINFGKLSGEVGTHVFISPELEERTLAKLGLTPEPASTQVISRVRHNQVTGLMVVNGGILERISTDIRLLSQTDVGEVREPFDLNEQDGSSAMPHKRNPELSERICGIARLIRGSALAESESIALWYERDISHSSVERSTFPDIFEYLTYAARLQNSIIEGLVVYPERMIENLNRTQGVIYSSRLLNELLARTKLTRKDAYNLIKPLSQKALDEGIPLQALITLEPQIRELFANRELAEIFKPDYYLRNIDVAYKRLGLLT